jgi:hypothetical protein
MSIQVDANGRPPDSRHLVTALAVFLALLSLAPPALAGSNARSAESGGPAPGPWCAAVIRINTKYGAMKNKHYLPQSQVSASNRKAIVDAAVATRNQLLALTPSSIKKAMTHELDYYAHLFANHYSPTTPFAPMTIADVHQLANFQRDTCGITGL